MTNKTRNTTSKNHAVSNCSFVKKEYGSRVVAEGVTLSNNTFETGLNNNDIIIGSSGSGKTQGYVIPNILQTTDSFICVDTKGSILNRTRQSLIKRGYRIELIDFKDPSNSTIGYSPFDYIGKYSNGDFNELDMKFIADVVNPQSAEQTDPFWMQAAGEYMQWAISYMLFFLTKKEHTMETVLKLINSISSDKFDRMVQQSECEAPDSLPARLGRSIYDTKHGAEKMYSSIIGILRNNVARINAKELNYLYLNDKRIDFADLGRNKTALFVNISDIDRSLDSLLNLFYSQALNALVRSADNDYKDCRLKVPCRIILDDFASNFIIPNFDNIISVIRSRDLYVSVIIQSLSQLTSMYGPHRAATILNNCDCQIYLGGQDVETGQYFASKCNRTVESILYMPLDNLYLFIRGQKPQLLKRYDFRRRYEEAQTAETEIDIPAAVDIQNGGVSAGKNLKCAI